MALGKETGLDWKTPSGKAAGVETPRQHHQKPQPGTRYRDLVVPLCPFIVRIKVPTSDKGMN